MPSDAPSSRLVVVGGGPAALETVRAYREHGGDGPVTVLSADRHPPYDRPPLSKDHLRGETSPDELPLEPPGFYRDHDVALQLDQVVTALDTDARTVLLDGGETLAYGTCVLATGSDPVRLPLPGGDHPDLVHLRSRVDGERLRALAEQATTAVVIGSGFIGCEAAASLAARGLEVVMVSQDERPQQQRLGDEVARRIHGWLTASGVRLVGGSAVSALHDGTRVELEDGSTHEADLVLVAAGVAPNGRLAEDAGLDCDGGRILTDSSMRTSAPGVLAAGDVALAHNDAAGRRLPVEHWGEAVRMGEVAGSVAAGHPDTWANAPGFWSQVGDRTLKYAAWGDGFDEVRLVAHGDEAFTVRYGSGGTLVGVLTHDADDDYEAGQADVEKHAPMPRG